MRSAPQEKEIDAAIFWLRQWVSYNRLVDDVLTRNNVPIEWMLSLIKSQVNPELEVEHPPIEHIDNAIVWLQLWYTRNVTVDDWVEEVAIPINWIIDLVKEYRSTV
jgi:hypothetical protein